MFIQPTEAAALPPVINAAVLMAENDWNVTVLTAPISGIDLAFPKHPGIDIRMMSERSSHVMSKRDFLRYTFRSIRLAQSQRPNIVYASDQLGAGPGLLAAKVARARLIYHEHDSPPPGAASMLRRLRATAARNADAIIFPNAERAGFAQAEIGFATDRLLIVWNMPRKSEVPPAAGSPDQPMIVYYHGSITPERLPLTVIDAVVRLRGAARLHVAGYEVSSAAGYLDEIQRRGIAENGQRLVQYLGLFGRRQLLEKAAQAHVGLALMPRSTDEINFQHMTGASNKIFDYMAAGLATLVSDLPDWGRQYVAGGFARACDPASAEAIAAALSWFRDNPCLRHEMGERSRAKILADWNYDTAFAPVVRLCQARFSQ
jgi:glycosyltransferase involved in cell wall biosynthesis